MYIILFTKLYIYIYIYTHTCVNKLLNYAKIYKISQTANTLPRLLLLPPTIARLPRRTAAYFDDGCDELLNEVLLQQLGPVVMEEVDEQSLDVGAVLVLIRHDHDPSVPESLQGLDCCVLLLVAQPDDLDHVVDLRVLHDLQRTHCNSRISGSQSVTSHTSH